MEQKQCPIIQLAHFSPMQWAKDNVISVGGKMECCHYWKHLFAGLSSLDAAPSTNV